MNILLILVGVILIVINYKAISKEKDSFHSVLMKQNEVSKDYDIELMAIRRDMAESILDLQKEIEDLKEMISSKSDVKDLKASYDIIKDMKENEEVISEINFNNSQNMNIDLIKVTDDISNKNNNVELIKEMIRKNYTDDEICKELQVGKGEVLLIRGLFK